MTAVTHIMVFDEAPGFAPFSGAENHLFTLMSAQRAAGMSVELIMLIGRKGPAITEEIDGLRLEGIGVFPVEMRLPKSMASRRVWEKRAVGEVRALLANRRGNVIHTHLDAANRVGRTAAWLSGCRRVVTTFHNDEPFYARTHWRAELKLMDRATSRYIAISESVKKHLVEKVGLPGKKIDVIHYGVKPRAYLMTRDEARDEMEVHRQSFVVGFVGRLTPQKNLPVLFCALGKVKDAEAVIVGEGEEGAALRKVAGQQRNANITFLGYRADAQDLMMGFDAFCLPSKWEGLGLVLIEAMLAGVPIVGSTAGAIPEILGGGEYGALFDPDDVDRLVSELTMIRMHPSKAREKARRARDYALKTYTVDAMVKMTAEVYREVDEGKGKHHGHGT